MGRLGGLPKINPVGLSQVWIIAGNNSITLNLTFKCTKKLPIPSQGIRGGFCPKFFSG